ncbi:MAG: DUF4342 domain-containing protein [Muribaculaceae bacterium]|nr:DUF4342 domain-containing protein [Roseburia sp.]MCM1432161.1 DUF4342 domain-containing protein [Muribaculaceae bacterium]MCM1492153.1 DUF4342 domain-containing protein [Muribaculaceae bacterium]
MDNFEKVEKLKERANVSYGEAKQALESCDWDILDAMIYLEKLGKTSGTAQSSTGTARTAKSDAADTGSEGSETFGEVMGRFGRWCKKWLDRGNSNSFCVDKKGKEILRVPLTLLIVLLIFTFWIIVPLLIVGLFFDMRYHFRGPDVKSVDLNRAMDSVADAAENLKNDIADSGR